MSDEQFLIKQQFTARLTPEEVQHVNENMIDLLPENMEAADVTNRAFLLHLIEKSMTKVTALRTSLPSDIEKIQTLKKEIDDYKRIQDENRLNTERLIEENTELTSQNQKLERENRATKQELLSLSRSLELLDSEKGKLSADLTKPGRIILDPPVLEKAVADEFISRLEKRLNKKITAGQMLWDLFWRYIKDQHAEIAFPFVMTRAEIKQLMLETKKKLAEPTEAE